MSTSQDQRTALGSTTSSHHSSTRSTQSPSSSTHNTIPSSTRSTQSPSSSTHNTIPSTITALQRQNQLLFDNLDSPVRQHLLTTYPDQFELDDGNETSHTVRSRGSSISSHPDDITAPTSPRSLRNELNEAFSNQILNPPVTQYLDLNQSSIRFNRSRTSPHRQTQRTTPVVAFDIPDNITIPMPAAQDSDTVQTHRSINSDSTISAVDNATTELPYHNPKFLGNMAYYYPPRLRQSTSALDTPPALPSAQPADRPSATISDPTPALDTDPAHDINEPSRPSRRFHQSDLHTCWDNFQSSCEVLKANESWGDDIAIKHSHTVRIYFQNINSCSLSTSCAKWAQILDSMLVSECDIMNFAQTSVNWRVLEIQNRMRQTLSRKMPIHKLNVSQNKYHTDQMTLPGGTAQVIKGDWAGRIVQYIHDPRRMGRWCGIKLRMKSERHLYIISAYRVCEQQASEIGVSTAYNQQTLLLSIDGMIFPDPRKVFIQDLIQQVKTWKNDMNDVIIVLDANEHLGDSVHGLAALMRECGLIDLLHHHHGSCPEFATYDRGLRRRLDYAIGSASLLPFLKQCGYIPFYQGIQSDHRGLFMDFSYEMIDGLTRLERAPTRYLHSAYTKDVYKYKQYVIKAFKSHNIISKSKALLLKSDLIHQHDAQYISDLNKLDKLVTEIQLKAERKSCPRRTKHDWSDDIHFTKVTVTYWNVLRKRSSTRVDSSKVAYKIYLTLPDNFRQYIDISTDTPLHNWMKSRMKLRNLMVQHRASIAKTQRAQYDNEATFNGSTVEKVILKHERKKKDKRLYQTLKHHFHPNNNSGITHVIVPDLDIQGIRTDNVDDAHTWRTETVPEKVLDRIFQRNIAHFGQAEGTPFTVEPLKAQLGYSGMSSVGVDMIEHGEPPSGIDQLCFHSKEVIDRLSDTSRCTPCNEEFVTLANFTKAITHWSEATSTSPSGKHLGHYKSLLAIDSHSNTYNDTNPDPGPIILEVIFNIAAAAFGSGISLLRWQQVTTCMIEKVTGLPRINKLRVIHLYEADYNAINKIVWQRGVVWKAHQAGTLNPAQHGSRPHRTCIEVVVSKDQKYMNSALTRIPMATMDNDAKSCYDRIVASLALLTSKHFGVSTEVCETVGATLQAMHFKIRTAMGDSPISYSHTDETPIHGVGQGGTASPAFWLLVSSILIDCYQKGATGMIMRDPSKSVVLQQWIEALVDDTSIFTNLDQGTDVATLVRALEKDTQNWEKLLSVSGGCLELTKCFYYILAWVFNEKGDAIPQTPLEIANVAAEIQLQELGKQEFTTIAIKHPSEAHRTLGVWKSMDGNVDEQIKVLEKRSKNMAAIVATSGMYPYQADVALRMIYTPSMCYSLPAVHISEAKLDKIQYKALESFVPTMGFNKGFPRDVILGPTDFGGEGVPHLYTESKLQQIEIVLMHLRARTELGKLFRINLQWIQLHAGIGTPYLESTAFIPYIDNWFSGLREFLIQIQGKIKVQAIVPPTIERQGDSLIMEAIAQYAPELSANQLCYMHNWRLYFQVQKLSDLTNAKGDKILPIYLKYPTASDIGQARSDRISKLSWPYQLPPRSKATFKLWVKVIRQCFLASIGSELRHRLGPWIVSASESDSHWQAYTNSGYSSLLDTTTTPYTLYETVSRRTSCTAIFDQACTFVDHIPSDFFPVVMFRRGNLVIAQHEKTKANLHINPVAVSSFDLQYTISNNISPSERNMLQHFRIIDLDKLLGNMKDASSTLLMVSDGAHYEDKGAFGVAVGSVEDDLYHLEGPVPYTEDITTPFRSEAYGLMANLSFLLLIITTYSIDMRNKKIHVYSDNNDLITWITEQTTYVTSPRTLLQHDADIITHTLFDIKVLQAIGITFTFSHVKGHQDRHNSYESLSRPAQLNVQANLHAKNYFHQGRREEYAELRHNPASFSICNRVVNDYLKISIRNASRSPAIRQYKIKKYHWNTQVPDLIWWQVFGDTIQSLSHPDRRRIRKYIYHWLPTCERLQMYNKEVSAECQSCIGTIETHEHLFRCPCQSRQDSRALWLKQFKKLLSNTRHTPIIIRDLLYNAVYARCNPTRRPAIDTHNSPADIKNAFQQQTQIGWDQVLCGRLAIGWSTAIANHLQRNNVDDSEMTAVTWGKTVIQHIFRFVINNWLQRNEEAHVRNSTNESLLTRERLVAQILQLQESSPDIRYCDRDFVYKSPEVLAQYTISNLRAFHRASLSIIKANKRRNRRDQSQPLITQHYDSTQRAPPRPNNSVHSTSTSTQVNGRPRVRERHANSNSNQVRSSSSRPGSSANLASLSDTSTSTANTHPSHTSLFSHLQQLNDSSTNSTTTA